MRRLVFLGLVVSAALVALVWAGELGLGPIVITHEDEQKIIMLFGNPRKVITRPGASLRIPFVEEVRTFDARRLDLNVEPTLIQTRDEERIVVDNYVVWRIAEPLLFYQSFPGGKQQAEGQIDRVVRADVREVIGQRTVPELLGRSRVEIMTTITQQSDLELRPRGIEVVDVRINRTELPPGTIENVYARMRTERERLARKLRAEGEEEARRIRAEADRDARVLRAEARRDAEVTSGRGDADAARIYAEAYSRDVEFYGFVRSLEAYRKTIGAKTTLVLPPSSEFFKLFESGKP
jgi:membrane protease subunit HflC